jgi:hypothetical protein
MKISQNPTNLTMKGSMLIIMAFIVGCGSYEVFDVPGIYVPVGYSSDRDTITLFPFDSSAPPFFWLGRYIHSFTDSSSVRCTFESRYKMQLAYAPDFGTTSGCFILNYLQWKSRAVSKPSIYSAVNIWLACTSNDSILLSLEDGRSHHEPKYVKINR